MKNINNKFIAPVVVTLILIVAAVSTTAISAHGFSEKGDLASKFAERFNLDEGEVESFFNEQKADHFANMQTVLEERLQKAVKNGKLTEEQKQEWLEMNEEFVTEMDSYSELNHEERMEMISQHHDQMRIWFDQNGVDKGTLMPIIGGMHNKGHKDFGFGHRFAE